ncbi:MAG: hypothetical protein KatS3mg026_1244 [Bacteroidia bacterium]|nr:MAG: hypothetical protein KatS3mg026_1244 [Bacteroidia bacterium]
MRHELKITGLVLGLSLVGFAQPAGEKAVGFLVSKDGVRAVSARFAAGGNPYLNLAVTAGLDQGRGFTAGVAFQQYLNTAVCGSGACGRGSSLAPYIEGGLRLRQTGQETAVDILGHVGGGLLLPLGPVEAFAQAMLYTPISSPRALVDVGGGLRLRF